MNPRGRANAKDPKIRTPLSLSSSSITICLIAWPGRLRLPCRHILVLGAPGFMEDPRHPRGPRTGFLPTARAPYPATSHSVANVMTLEYSICIQCCDNGYSQASATLGLIKSENDMVRADLVTLLAAQHPDLPTRELEAIVSAFFDTITARLADGGRVEIRGFGSFSTRDRDARVGRNPGTGESVEVRAKRLPHFVPGKDLRKRVADLKA